MKLSEVDLKRTYRTWHEVAGHFRCFVRASNFVSLKHYPDFELMPLAEGEQGLVEELVKRVTNMDLDKTLLMVDLPDFLSILGALKLYQNRGILPIITFKGVLHPHGLVGTRGYIGHLLQGEAVMGPALKDEKLKKHYAFFLDSQRYGIEDAQKLQKSFNNQYELNEEDLPDAERLRFLGYDQVVYIGNGTLKEDMTSYLEYLGEQGMVVNQVRLEERDEVLGGC